MPGTNGNRPQIKRLKLDSLFIDKRYQRTLNVDRVARIAGDFEPELCTALEVSARPGDKFAVLDGQHRLNGLQLLDATEWDCRIHEGLNSREEAALFVRFQTERMSVKPVDRHRALLHKRDATAVAVENVVNEAGFRITGNKTHGSLRCVTQLYQAHARFGSSAISDALSTIENVWTKEDTYARKAPMVIGLVTLYGSKSTGGKLDKEILEEKLGDIKSTTIVRDSQMQGGSNTTRANRMAMQLLQIYNRGRTTGRVVMSFGGS